MTTDGSRWNRYIAFEGVEGAGKSSVAAAVAERLRASGIDVLEVREPGGTSVGEAVRAILLDGEQHPLPRAEAALFASARAQLIAERVRPALEAGRWVVSDRSAYSSLAYQAGGRGLPMDEVRTLNDIAIGGLWPTTVFLLRIESDQGLLRQAVADRIGAESGAFFAQVVRTFDELAEAEPDRFDVVDATVGLDEVVEEVIARLASKR